MPSVIGDAAAADSAINEPEMAAMGHQFHQIDSPALRVDVNGVFSTAAAASEDTEEDDGRGRLEGG